MKQWKLKAVSVVKEILEVYWTLLKVMLPAVIVVKVLDMIGGTLWLASLLAPIMKFVGLPEALGLVWATAILTNIYTTMVVFIDVVQDIQLTTAQVSVIGVLILISHSIPVEGAIARMMGISWPLTILLRIVGSLVLAAVVNYTYTFAEYQQQEATILWQPAVSEEGLLNWVLDQLVLFSTILLVIAVLIIGLKILRLIGVEALMQNMLSPLLKVLTIGKEATHITIIGITLGISFGAGLLISEVKSGRISRRDVILSMSFLSLAHSLIEDTLLILLLGADIVAVLWMRLAFAIIVVAAIAKILPRPKKEFIENTPVVP